MLPHWEGNIDIILILYGLSMMPQPGGNIDNFLGKKSNIGWPDRDTKYIAQYR